MRTEVVSRWIRGRRKKRRPEARLSTTFGIDADVASLRDNHFVQHASSVTAARFLLLLFLRSLDRNMWLSTSLTQGLALSAPDSQAKRNLSFSHTERADYATLMARMVPEALKSGLIGFWKAAKRKTCFRPLSHECSLRILDLSQIAGLNVVELHRLSRPPNRLCWGRWSIRTALDSFPSVLFFTEPSEQSRRGLQRALKTRVTNLMRDLCRRVRNSAGDRFRICLWPNICRIVSFMCSIILALHTGYSIRSLHLIAAQYRLVSVRSPDRSAPVR